MLGRSLLVKCNINQRYANPKAALYNYFHKKMIKKKKKVSEIFTFDAYARYKKIIERFDLAFHFFVNNDRYHITTPIFNEESLVLYNIYILIAIQVNVTYRTI